MSLETFFFFFLFFNKLPSPGPQIKKRTEVGIYTLQVKIHLVFDSGGSFLTLVGGSAGTPRRLPQRLLFDFSSRGDF